MIPQAEGNITQVESRVTRLRASVPFSVDQDRGLQIVVPAGPEGALEEGAVLDSHLDG